MSKKNDSASADLMPLHTFLHRRVREIPHLTNVQVATALGYERPNVVAMMFNGSMKIPINKVPALAQVLELDPLALLRRVMDSYSPEVWETIEQIVGKANINTANEVALLEVFRGLLGHDDIPLHEDAKFISSMTAAVLSAHDRHLRQTLATRRDEAVHRDSRAGRANAALLDLIRKQAQERAALLLSFR